MKRYLLIPADSSEPCSWEAVPPKEADNLSVLQKAVGGYIEHVALEFDNGDPDAEDSVGLSLWVNEEGKLMRLPVNSRATDVWMLYFGPTDLIVGNALLEIRGPASRRIQRWLDDIAPADLTAAPAPEASL